MLLELTSARCTIYTNSGPTGQGRGQPLGARATVGASGQVPLGPVAQAGICRVSRPASIVGTGDQGDMGLVSGGHVAPPKTAFLVPPSLKSR